MRKALAHFIVLAALFFGCWFLLSSIDFVKHFNVEQLTGENEHKLGTLILDAAKQGRDEVESDSVQTFVDSIIKKLCKANSINDSTITLHILIKDDVNAFALPDRHLVLYTGLLTYCNSPEELSGVLAHEIAHMEHGHVMKKLMKEVGLSMLMTIAGGDAGGTIGREMVKLLSSTAFDREQEREADISAVHMMAKADIDPKHLANFLFRLSQEKNTLPKHFEWISTHPNSQDRASEILKQCKEETYHTIPIADSTQWAAMRKIVNESIKK
jgi:predicted Zn-dependent protease